ncbi:adhesion G-protein coupled receptor G6-like [Musca autumnalis]|uniref:adhesion G-protein coupled receptor G6-like n=1 Tax=Musca autumnalis TaxID=221902 RepID=UPI003CECCD49
MRLTLLILLSCGLSVLNAEQWCKKDIYESRIHSVNKVVEVVAIWNPMRVGSTKILELCSSRNGLPFKRDCSYNTNEASASWDVVKSNTEFINCNSISYICKSEEFQHFYLNKNRQRAKFTNRWHSAKMGELAITQEPCLLATGLPLTKRCIYNPQHYAVEWEENRDLENAKCLLELNENIITFDLYKLYNEAIANNSPQNAAAVISKLRNLLAKSGTVRTPADIEISTRILNTIGEEYSNTELVPIILDIINILIESPENIKNSSQKLNTPAVLIDYLENYYNTMAHRIFQDNKCGLTANGVVYFTTNHISVFYLKPSCSNLTGIATYNTLTHPSADMFFDSNVQRYIRYLHMNESLHNILGEPHLQMVSYIPQSTWEFVSQNVIKNKHNDVIRIILYANGSLFNKSGFKVDSQVLSISIPGYKGNLSESIPVILQYSKLEDEPSAVCSSYIDNTWIDNNDTPVLPQHQNLLLCHTRHLKPLAAVRRVEPENTESITMSLLTLIRDSFVDVVSVLGCGFALFGLLCIWMTALCCTRWRSKTSYQLLMNLCFVLTLITVCFLLINISTVWDAVVNINNDYHCVAIGAFLQYTILVLLMWMLFIGILQYQRIKAVVGIVRTSHFVAKYALAAWGLPMVPIALLVLLDRKSYIPQGGDPICYPSGIGFYLTVAVPITCLVVLNVAVLIYIVYNLRRSLIDYRNSKRRQELCIQVRFAICLFVLLVSSLVFGILAHRNVSLLFSFLFCLTSTMQGLMLFVYFVVVDKNDQFAWIRCCVPKDYFPIPDNAMTQLTMFSAEDKDTI